MAEDLKLAASPREGTGSGESGRLRRAGILPAVVYGDGKEGQAIQVKEHEMEQILRHHASGNVLLNLEVEGGKAEKVLLKDVQHHPLTGRLVHADFHTISMTETLKIDVPIEFLGEPPGVSQQGGTLEHLLHEVEIECLPGDILEKIELDVSGLHIGETLLVSDIPVDVSKFTVLTAGDIAVAGVAAPRVEEEPSVEEEAEAAVEGAEPEVITEKKEEGEAEAE